ncbi:helix-turn-helix domain containing protein [Microbacterium horticulturae]|uniref:Helix-turn-helix domain containing protein n=1 Tax=Microbacterium horticulturae TaxID=3028316 RepID=A0ABY8C011_9MICO|nr:TetR/AcrR family transcriptional regulator [Microbacterium sp. KACC 23027]WEG09462.1 helix-turn-helix domain containing protein [Microbacterium sp. KACC 23027]
MPESVSRTRADAQANRRKLLDAAGELIAERGVEVPLHAVADRAGVGVGTLYRNFADRDALLTALGDRPAQRFKDIARAAAAAATAWKAVEIYVDGYIALYAEFPWMLSMRVEDRRLRRRDEEDATAAQAVVDRARTEGALRADVGMLDIAFAATMVAAMTYLPEPVRATVVPRLRDVVLDGLRAEGMPRPELGASTMSVDELKGFVRPLA